MQKRLGKSGIAAKSFFGSVLPAILIAAVLVTAALHLSGIIDLKQVGKQIKSAFAPSTEKESSYPFEPPELPKLVFVDGTVAEPYEQTIRARYENNPDAAVKFDLGDPEYEPLPPGLSLSSSTGVVSGVPTKKGKYVFEICAQDAEERWTCYEGHITINPKQQPPVAVLTGNFTGPFEFTDNVGNPLFRDNGILNLRLTQDGNGISGVYTFTQIKMTQLHSFDQVQLGTSAPDFSKSITGKLNGARIDFTDGWIEFAGNFDSDQIRLNFQSCQLNLCCENPEHKEYTGEPTTSTELGVPDVPAPSYSCEMGIKGTATLNKIAAKEEPEEEPTEEKKQPVLHKGISIFDIPIYCILKRSDACKLFNCIYEECRCVDSPNPIVYEKDVAINTEEDAMNLVKEYVESKKLGYVVSSAMKLNDVFYNIFTIGNGAEIVYTVTSNGIVMKTECGV